MQQHLFHKKQQARAKSSRHSRNSSASRGRGDESIGEDEQAELGSASERAKGWGAVWESPGHAAQYYYHVLLARLGMGEGERAKHKCWKQSLEKRRRQ